MAFDKRTLIDLSHVASRALLGKHRVFLYRRARAWRDLRRLARADVAFVSHAKAGRTWTRVMLSRLYQLKFSLDDTDIINRENFSRHDPRIPVFLFTMGNYISDVRPISGEASPYHAKKLIFLARHPADTAVSMYFHHRTRIKPHLKDIKRVSDDLGDVPLFEFMKNQRYGLAAVIDYMNRWAEALRTHPCHLLLWYEHLREAPQRELMRIADFLEVEFTASQYADAIEFASFDKLKEKETQNFFGRSRLQARDTQQSGKFQSPPRKSRWLPRLFHRRADRLDRKIHRFKPHFGPWMFGHTQASLLNDCKGMRPKCWSRPRKNCPVRRPAARIETTIC